MSALLLAYWCCGIGAIVVFLWAVMPRRNGGRS